MPILRATVCLLIAGVLPHSLAYQSLESYKAAVVEYHTLGNPLDGANSVLGINVANYENFIKEAANNGSEIVVFPEYGLVPLSASTNRTELTEYAQEVPQVTQGNNEVRSSPCEQEEVSWVIKRISCSARENQIYVVINLSEMVPCSDQDDECPQDGFYIYNSNIVFDRHGNVISKYWKFHLFLEGALDTPKEASHSIFTTDFGITFGMFICFDILWKEPAFDVANYENVTDIVFPTAWFSELPFHSALQVQAAWSLALRVNLLASNNNNIEKGGGGSGIFSGVQGALSTYMPPKTGSKLLIASVPKIDVRLKASKEVTNQYDEIKSNSLKDLALYLQYENIESYNRSLPFKDGESEAVVCSGDFCCQFYADIELSNASSDSTYRFIAFKGVRYLADVYKYSFQICSIIHCQGNDFLTCGRAPSGSYSESIINSLKISGNFNTSQMVLPNSVDYDLIPIRAELFEFTTYEKEFHVTSNHHMKNVLSFSIYGRDFHGDK